MKYFHCTAACGNFNCYSTAEAKDLIYIPSSFPLRCFLLTNFTITLLLDSLLYLETGKQWQPSMSFGSISKPELWQMSIKTFSRLFSGISFRIPDNSMLLCWLYCSDLAWFFSRQIHSSSLVFTFFTTASTFLIFTFVECRWDIVSFNFDIWLQRLDISASAITFPFKATIFYTSSGFFMAFIADSDKVNKLVLSPILIWINLTSPHREMRLRF